MKAEETEARIRRRRDTPFFEPSGTRRGLPAADCWHSGDEHICPNESVYEEQMR